MTNKIDEIYNQTIQLLKQNARALPKYSPETITEIKDEFQKINLESLNADQLKELAYKISCIFTNTQTTSVELQEILVKIYNKVVLLKNNSEFIILLLGAISKQFIDHSSKTGSPIPTSVMEILKFNLKSKNPEVLEWTLRAIDSLGAQGLRLEKEVKNLRPSLLKIFNKHQQTAFQIVEHIEKEWSRLKNEKGR